MKGFGSQRKSKKKEGNMMITFDAEKIINQAIKLQTAGNISEASKYYQYLINQGLNDYLVFINYGTILNDIGKLKEAELFYRKAIELNPDCPEVYSNLGVTLFNLGRLKEAEIAYRKAIELNPNYAIAYSNLGSVLKDLGKLKEAEISTRKAIELDPNFADSYFILANILKTLGKLKEAELSYRKAIELNPYHSKAYSNLGIILKNFSKLKEAELSYRKAIELDPNYADAYFNLSLIELLQGRYKDGLVNYEFRFKTNNPALIHGNSKLNHLNDKKLKKQEKLLVISEQGLGDTLQFMRYIPYLRSQGFKISFCAQEKLHTLIQSSGIDHNPLKPEQAEMISEGQWCPLLSLPRYLQIDPNNPIISEPYIFVTKDLKRKWKNILSKEKRPIIGINWQGNPNVERKGLRGRSLPLEAFSIIARNNNLKLLSLQKGFGSEQLEDCSFKSKFIEYQSEINITWDFLENAAIIENCDLIITSDTSIAHLAGGMGKSTWLLLHSLPEWRWGLESKTTFWYPSVRLFRQKEPNNWREVMEEVSSKLKKEWN